MIMRDRSNLLKNLLVLGAAGASLVVSLPALSQTSSESTAPREVVMSAEGMKILCQVTPLNSRCPGGEQPTAVPSVSEPRESAAPPASLEPQTTPSISPQPSAPGETTSPSVEPSAPEPSGGMSPGGKPSSGSVESPGSTPGSTMPTSPAPKPQNLTAPETTAPAETTAPSLSPNMPPSYPSKAGTATKGEADGLRTEVPASAQTPAAPSATPSRTPSMSPALQTPSATPASPQNPSVAPATGTPAAAISPAELQKFAEVIPQLQEIQKSAQQQVSEAVKKAGLSEDRFRELYGVQQSPTASQASTPATPQEQQAVQQVVSQLETIKSEAQTRRVQAVESQGLELTRFNEILTAVRQDSDLQQQLQRILSN